MPNHFSEVYDLISGRARQPYVIASVAPPDRFGNFSLGTSADYASSFIWRVPFFVEVNARMPRTYGRSQIHVSPVDGYVETDYPLVTVEPAAPRDIDHRIGGFVLSGHRDLGVHAELISDGLIDRIDSGVVNVVSKTTNRLKFIGTFARGTQRLYDFIHDNPTIEMWSARVVNDPREVLLVVGRPERLRAWGA